MSIELKSEGARMLIDEPGWFTYCIRLKNGSILVIYYWGDDRVPTQAEDEEFYAMNCPTTSQDWIDYNDRLSKRHPVYCHVLTCRCVRSDDNGKTFYKIGIPPIIEYAELDNGDILGFQWYTYIGENGGQIVRSWRSHDGCRSWDAPVDIPIACPPVAVSYNRHDTPFFCAYRRVIHLEGPQWLVLGYGRFEGDKGDRSFVLRTTDTFETLHYYSTIGYPDTSVEAGNLNESDFVRVPDGRWLAVMRSNGYLPLYQSQSADDAASWQPYRLFGAPGVNPALGVLQNGVVVCSYGRPGIHVAFSEDGGDSWKKRTCLYHFDTSLQGHANALNQSARRLSDRSCCYTDLCEAEENHVLVFYSAPKELSDQTVQHPWDAAQRQSFRIFLREIEVVRNN